MTASFIKSVTFDCADAVRLATFWAAALGSDVDEDSTVVKAFVEPAGWGGPTLWFQRVPEEQEREEPDALRPASTGRRGGRGGATGRAGCHPRRRDRRPRRDAGPRGQRVLRGVGAGQPTRPAAPGSDHTSHIGPDGRTVETPRVPRTRDQGTSFSAHDDSRPLPAPQRPRPYA